MCDPQPIQVLPSADICQNVLQPHVQGGDILCSGIGRWRKAVASEDIASDSRQVLHVVD